MNTMQEKLNEMLVEVYKDVMKVEQQMVTGGRTPLTISEVHFLEAVGKDEGREKTISELAAHLGITLSSVTIAAKKLIAKGYLIKEKSENDGRQVRVSLTREGQKIERLHRYFHRKMVAEILAGFTQEEEAVLLAGVQKLDTFLKKKGLLLEE